MTSIMLVHIKNMSLWEVAHYWHNYDPRESKTHNLPLKVRDTLLVLAMSYCKKLCLRVENHKAYLLELVGYAPRLTARHYKTSFKKSIDSKVFGKQFYSGMYITRSQLARWCVEHNEPLPQFWFPDNEKFPYDATGDLGDEITVGGRYKLMMLYDDTVKVSGETSLVQPIVTTVNENAIKAANAKHAHRNSIKARFISFYQSEGSNHPSKTASAEHFYESLDDLQEKLLFEHRDAAIRTLLDALRTHLKEAKTSK